MDSTESPPSSPSPPSSSGPSFNEEHTLADGCRLTLRFIRPDDADELRRGFAHLSRESRYRRFLSEVSTLTDEMIDYLTKIDGQNHVAVVATTDSPDLKTEVGLGVARFIRLNDEPEVAEAAVTVADEAQGRGIGRLLLIALAKLAIERGIKTIRAEVLASNEPMRKLLSEVGAVVRSDDGATLVFDVPLVWPPESEEAHKDHPLRRLLRFIAEFGR